MVIMTTAALALKRKNSVFWRSPEGRNLREASALDQ
jgi:hypothetical protein